MLFRFTITGNNIRFSQMPGTTERLSWTEEMSPNGVMGVIHRWSNHTIDASDIMPGIISATMIRLSVEAVTS